MTFNGLILWASIRAYKFEQIALRRIVLCRFGNCRAIFKLTPERGWVPHCFRGPHDAKH